MTLVRGRMNLKTMKPSYLLRRVAQWSFQRSHRDVPWLTENAVYALAEWIRPGDVGFEWGSGRSTVWFASRCGRVTSVEGDRAWFDHVSEMLAESGIGQRVEYRYVPCSLNTADDESSNANHPYASEIDRCEDSSLDWVLVDGALRMRCMEHALEKVKRGGLLILDNANWYLPNYTGDRARTFAGARRACASAGWEALQRKLAGWRAFVASDGISETRFWVRPQ